MSRAPLLDSERDNLKLLVFEYEFYTFRIGSTILCTRLFYCNYVGYIYMERGGERGRERSDPSRRPRKIMSQNPIMALDL